MRQYPPAYRVSTLRSLCPADVERSEGRAASATTTAAVAARGEGGHTARSADPSAVDGTGRAAYGRSMGNRHSGNRALSVVALVLTGVALAWVFRRRWTDHDVSDPGVSL